MNVVAQKFLHSFAACHTQEMSKCCSASELAWFSTQCNYTLTTRPFAQCHNLISGQISRAKLFSMFSSKYWGSIFSNSSCQQHLSIFNLCKQLPWTQMFNPTPCGLFLFNNNYSGVPIVKGSFTYNWVVFITLVADTGFMRTHTQLAATFGQFKL